jgi:hypothetical protein
VIAPETFRFLDLFVRVGNWLPGVENPDPLHRVRVTMRNDHSIQQHVMLDNYNQTDAITAKLKRLARLLAHQEALDFIKKIGTIDAEVQP